MWESERITDIDSLVKNSTDFVIPTIWILKLMWKKFRQAYFVLHFREELQFGAHMAIWWTGTCSH